MSHALFSLMKIILHYIICFISVFLPAHVSFSQEVDATVELVHELPEFDVESTVIKRVVAVEPAPLSGMVPVEKEISITQNMVVDPQLPDPIPAAPVVFTAEDIARRKAWAALQPPRVVVHLSATVYDHQRTLLRWYLNGKLKEEMVAWSAVDFSVLAGMGGFTHEGVEYDFMLGLGIITDVDTERQRLTAVRRGIVYQAPVFPVLPTADGAEFVVTKGDAANADLMAPIRALHEYYAAHSAELIAAYAVRQAKWRAHEAYVRAHPPEPQDVVVNFWKRDHALANDVVAEQENTTDGDQEVEP